MVKELVITNIGHVEILTTIGSVCDPQRVFRYLEGSRMVSRLAMLGGDFLGALPPFIEEMTRAGAKKDRWLTDDRRITCLVSDISLAVVDLVRERTALLLDMAAVAEAVNKFALLRAEEGGINSSALIFLGDALRSMLNDGVAGSGSIYRKIGELYEGLDKDKWSTRDFLVRQSLYKLKSLCADWKAKKQSELLSRVVHLDEPDGDKMALAAGTEDGPPASE